MMQTLFPNGEGVFQDDDAPIHTAGVIKSWHAEHFSHLPDLNIIEPLWSILEARIRSVFPPPSSLKALEKLLIQEWYNIPLETIQKLYDSKN